MVEEREQSRGLCHTAEILGPGHWLEPLLILKDASWLVEVWGAESFSVNRICVFLFEKKIVVVVVIVMCLLCVHVGTSVPRGGQRCEFTFYFSVL